MLNKAPIEITFDAKEWFMGGSLIRSKLKRERDIGIRQVTVFKP
jgi:hypothetical protein